MKRFVILLLTAVLALTMPLSALAAGQIEVTEDISVSDDYDWTRFKGQNVTLNVYNWVRVTLLFSLDVKVLAISYDFCDDVNTLNHQDKLPSKNIFAIFKTFYLNYNYIKITLKFY
jgi:spermidine/putrescine transport system substrate-binding protein